MRNTSRLAALAYMSAMFFLFLCLLFAPLFLTGCIHGRASAGLVGITQSAPAETPATATSDTTTTTLPVAAGSTVEANPAGEIRVTLSAPAMLTTTARRDAATGPRSYAPPAPPTPSELAAGRAAWVYHLAAFAGVVAAVFGFVRAWDFVAWGGVAVTAGGLFGIFVDRHPALLALIGAGVAFAGAGVLLWHLHKRKLAPASPAPAA